LRPRPQRNNVETANEHIIDDPDPDYEVVGDFLPDNEGIVFPKISKNICCNSMLEFLRTYVDIFIFLSIQICIVVLKRGMEGKSPQCLTYSQGQLTCPKSK
jgi:hypothetical protein